MLNVLLLASTVMFSCGLLARWRLGHWLQDPQEANHSLYEWLSHVASQYGCIVILRPGPPLAAGFAIGKKCLILPEIPAAPCLPAPSQLRLAMAIHEIGHACQLYEASWLWRVWGGCRTWGELGAFVGWTGIFAGLLFPGLAASPFWFPAALTGWGLAHICGLMRVCLEWDASQRGLQLAIHRDCRVASDPAGARLVHILQLAALSYLLWPVILEEFWPRTLWRVAAAVAGD